MEHVLNTTQEPVGEIGSGSWLREHRSREHCAVSNKLRSHICKIPYIRLSIIIHYIVQHNPESPQSRVKERSRWLRCVVM